MIFKLQDGTLQLDDDRKIVSTSKLLSDMITSLDIKDTKDVEIPVDTTIKKLRKFISCLKSEDIRALSFDELIDLLVISHFFQTQLLYRMCCIKIQRLTMYSSQDEILDLFDVHGEAREKLSQDENFTLDLFCNRDKN